MAILTEHLEDIQHGAAKVIDDSGVNMMFDMFQKYQYNHPIKSTVRELLSNGVDSVHEKDMARKILSGQAQVTDYFEDLQGDIYKDSKWTPDYYNLKWLSDNNDVTISYVVGQHLAKDKVIIYDNGVGLGGKRMEGYFKLSYSTKRLQKKPLGKFGIGAKAAFSIGLNFYTVENYYNGRLFKFNVFSRSFTSIIGKFNLENNKENDFIIMYEGTLNEYKVYYEKTEEKNGLIITLEAKSHHRPQYIDAVKSQMLYFDNIVCNIIDGTKVENVDYRAKILYEDDCIVMSDNNYFTQPHLLLNKVNYGFIDWAELELETKTGNIGIKVVPEDVDVSPSRESVLWTDITKTMVLQRFNKVVEIASDMIQKELEDTDLIGWLKSCYQVSGRSWKDNQGILSRLAKIVDLSRVKPKFSLDQKLKFDFAAPLPGIYMRYVSKVDNYRAKDTDREVERQFVESLNSRFDRPMYLFRHEDRASNRKDKYLLTLYSSGFTLLHQPYATREEREEANMPIYMLDFYNKTEGTGIWHGEIWQRLIESSYTKWYHEIEVPEGWTDKVPEKIEDLKAEEEKTTEEVKQQAKLKSLTAAERRKLEGKTIIHMIETLSGWSHRNVIEYDDDGVTVLNNYAEWSAYQFNKLEVPIKLINDWSGEVYYGNDSDAQTLHFVAMLTRDPANELGTDVRSSAKEVGSFVNSKWWRLNKDTVGKYKINDYDAYRYQHFFDNTVTLVKVAQSTNKLYRDFKHVNQFFLQIKDKTVITMSNVLVKWNTARVIINKLPDLAFLYNFAEFNPEYAEMYEELCLYVAKNYRSMRAHSGGTTYGLEGSTYTDLISHLDSVRKFQEFVMSDAEPSKISELAKELFGNPELRDGMAVDPVMIGMLNRVAEYSVACGELMNYMPILTGYMEWSKRQAFVATDSSRKKINIPQEVSMEIRGYLEFRGIDKWGQEPEVNEDQEMILRGLAQLEEHAHIPKSYINPAEEFTDEEREILDIMHS